MSGPKKKILLVEDDHDLREIILAQLSGLDYEIDFTDHGLKAKEMIEKKAYDLYLFDWMIPGPNGLELCRFVQQKHQYIADSQSPSIIMISAKASPQFIVEGLDSGADDYITKPFTMEVLLARLRVHLRKRNISIFTYGPFQINESKHEILCDGSPLSLTGSEFKILKALIERPGHVFTRKQLIESMAGSGIHVGGRTIDTQLVGLRKKMAQQGSLIETIRGIGYRFKEC